MAENTVRIINSSTEIIGSRVAKATADTVFIHCGAVTDFRHGPYPSECAKRHAWQNHQLLKLCLNNDMYLYRRFSYKNLRAACIILRNQYLRLSRLPSVVAHRIGITFGYRMAFPLTILS